VRDRVPVDVRVEHARALAEARERRAEVGRERGLAHAPLAARHGDDARGGVDGDPRRALGDAAAQLGRERLLLLRRHDREGQRDRLEPVERRERALDLLLEALAERAAGDRQGEQHRGMRALDLHVADHVELDHGAVELRVDHGLEGLRDVLARRGHVDYPSSARPPENPC
jgi:hypothetical protein